MAIVLSLTICGCGSSDGTPTADELVRKRLLRDSLQQTKPKTLEERMAHAAGLLEQGNLVLASKELQSLLISDGENTEVIFLSARCAEKQGETIAAVRLLESIPSKDQQAYLEALKISSKWLSDANEWAMTQERLERLLEIDPSDHASRHRLADALNRQGKRTLAVVQLQKLAEEGDISERELCAMNTAREPFLDDKKKGNIDVGEELKSEMLYHAMEFRMDGELDAAKHLIVSLAKAFPDSTPIIAYEGLVYTDLVDDNNLTDWFTRLPDQIEKEPTYWFVMGSFMQRHGQNQEAVRCFLEAVARDQTDRFSYKALAGSLQILGETEAASRVIQRFDRLDEAARIVKRFSRRAGTLEELRRITDLMVELRRPWEAIGWTNVEVRIHGGLPKSIAKRLATGGELLTQPSEPDSLEFITCGIKRQDWQLPQLNKLPSIDSAVASHPKAEAFEGSPLSLVNVANELGLNFQYDNRNNPNDPKNYLHQVNGGGIGIVDFNLDGWPDIYLTQGGGNVFTNNSPKSNALFLNKGVAVSHQENRFVDVTLAAHADNRGYGQGIAVSDINQDGFPDLVIANIGINSILINNGDGSFSDRDMPQSRPGGMWTSTIACGDLSGDGLPEIVEVNYVDDASAITSPCVAKINECSPAGFKSASDFVWQTQEDGSIELWRGCRDMATSPSYGLAAVIASFDSKNGNDLYIAADGSFNPLWLSQSTDDENGASSTDKYHLIESGQLLGCASGMFGERFGSMGIASGDFDRNGLIDLHVTNYWNQPADLFMQTKGGLFVNKTTSLGLQSESRKTVAWGTQAVDFDHDGWLDLAVLNGHVIDHRDQGEPLQMRPQLFRGGVDGFQFVEPDSSEYSYWSKPTLGRTMAIIDWNRDGKIDLVTNHLDVPVALLENRTETQNSIQFELIGSQSERDAIGAKVTIQCGTDQSTHWHVGGDGFFCCNESFIDFGVGQEKQVDRIEVTWPSGKLQSFGKLMANKRYLVVENADEVFER